MALWSHGPWPRRILHAPGIGAVVAATFGPFDRAKRLKPATGYGLVVVCVVAQDLDREDDRPRHAVLGVDAGGQDDRFNLNRAFLRATR